MYKRHGHNNLAKCIKAIKMATEGQGYILNELLCGLCDTRKGRKFLRKCNLLQEGY